MLPREGNGEPPLSTCQETRYDQANTDRRDDRRKQWRRLAMMVARVPGTDSAR